MYSKREWSILCTTKVLARKSAKKNDNWMENSEVELSRKPEVESRNRMGGSGKRSSKLPGSGKRQSFSFSNSSVFVVSKRASGQLGPFWAH